MSKSRPTSLIVPATQAAELAHLVPSSPRLDWVGSTLKNKRSLKQLWDEADKRFFEETGYHIETASPQHKGGVLQKWQARYDGEKSSMQLKLDRLSPILQNIINGIEIVGGFAASTASAIFGPAQMCFNAVTFLLDAPGKIRHVYDCLEELFKEIANFLVKFRVLERIDQKGALDDELLENANKLLISFTHICAVAITLLKRKRFVLQALEVVFLTNDGGVSAALAEFKDLAVSQAQTVGVISLEHILQSEDLSRQILSEQYKLTTYLRTVANKENDEKTKLITKQKIVEIESKLFTRTESDQLEQPQQKIDTLRGTLDVLMASKEYGVWSDVGTGGTLELYLSGANGTGKSHFIDALKDHLVQKRQNMLKQGPSLYVAHHSFADRRAAMTSSNAVTQALKNMALQVAHQSTRYSEKLLEQLRDRKLTDENDIKRTWSTLKLFDFLPPAGSAMYLLVDGLQGDDGFKSMQALRRLLADAKTPDALGGRFKVCVLFAGVPEVIKDNSIHRSVVINMRILNKGLLTTFIDQELLANEILLELDEKTRMQRAKFAEALLQRSEGNFHAARQKIKRIREALDDDATSLEVEAIIEEGVQQTFDQQARETLNLLAKELRPKHLKQLKTIVMWLLYGQPSGRYFRTPVLEAILRVQQKDDTLESLQKKITKRFHKIILIGYGDVWVDEDIAEYLRHFKEATRPELDENARLISMTINIQNAKKTEVQKFLLDLNTRLASDASMFSQDGSSPPGCQIQISEVESLVEITTFSLTTLNEGVPDDAVTVLLYAFRWLPRNLAGLLKLKPKISKAHMRQIRMGLTTFLSDPYYFEHTAGLEPDDSWDSAWFGGSKAAKAINTWLDDCLNDPSSQNHLPARQRRWLKEASLRNNGLGDYLKETALAMAARWRNACLEQNLKCIEPFAEWLGGYIEFANDPDDALKPKDDLVSNGNNENEALPKILLRSPTVDDASSSTLDASVNEEPISADIQRLYRVAEWTKQNLPDVQADAAHFYCIGTTLYQKMEYTAASDWFEKAKADEKTGWRSLVGLAQIKVAKKLPEEAAILYRQGVTVARDLQQQGKLEQHEIELFCRTLKTLAMVCDQKLNQTEDAVDYLREILIHKPRDGRCRWALFGALCREKRYEEATELLDYWTHRPEECGAKDPKEVLCEMAAEGVDMFALFEATRENVLRERLLSISEHAASDAGHQSQFIVQTRLLYVLAAAYANNPSTEDQHKAFRYLEEILELSQTQLSDREKFNAVLSDTSRFASRMKFDDIRKQFHGQDPICGTALSPEILREELNRFVTKQAAAYSDVDVDLYWLVASFCMIMNRPQWSRDLLKQDISNGVQILSDDNTENDVTGVENLLRAFVCLNEDVNARIAFSIADRTYRKQSLLNPGEKQEVRESFETINRGCDICDVWLPSIHGFWMCRWCPEVDFCQSCFEGFRGGKKHYENCSPEHEFVHLYHPECGIEELENGKVLVDWEIQYDEKGDFTRTGGHLVDMAEWVEGLRIEWDLPAPSTDTRAQA